MSDRGSKSVAILGLGIVLAGLLFVSFRKGVFVSDPNATLLLNLPKVTLVTDPHRFEDAHSMLIVGQLYRGLLRYSLAGEVLPDLAASWTQNTDGTKFTFQLGDFTFSNGERITSKHVVDSFGRLFYLEAAMAADLSYVVGVEEFKSSHDISKLGIRAVSERKIEFNLKNPSAIFLKQIAVIDCAILPISSYKVDELERAWSI